MASSKAGKLTLRGRFSPGSTVRLVKVDGPHVMRPGPNDETVDEQKVDKDGTLEFSKGVSVGDRYFAVGQVDGQHREVRLTGRTEDDPGHLAGYEPVSPDRARVGIGGTGGWADEPQPRQDGDEQTVDGQTWLAQDQVSKGTVQRSDTIRGSAHPISVDERERAVIQWRKQEPPAPIVQETTDAAGEPARTAEEPDRSAAKSSRRSTSSRKD
jgi:hypothetical protein